MSAPSRLPLFTRYFLAHCGLPLTQCTKLIDKQGQIMDRADRRQHRPHTFCCSRCGSKGCSSNFISSKMLSFERCRSLNSVFEGQAEADEV